MNVLLSRLSKMWEKESRLIIGLMSGTSLDGLDIALCRIKGYGLNTKVHILEFETLNYSEGFKENIKSIFSKEQISLQKLTLMNVKTAEIQAEMINSCLKKWNRKAEDIDCIASHGQTIYHAPKRLHKLAEFPNATLQIGDGDHIAFKTGIITLSDFRQKHIASGGEGAPLALYGDCILFSSESENRVLLNIGGISNFTYLPSDKDSSKIICTDIGPGNTLIDALVKKFFDLSYDKNGDIAKSGTVNQQLLERLLSHPFFKETLPKSTGPELFNLNFLDENLTMAGITAIKPEDLIATVSQFTAKAISIGIKQGLRDTEFSMYVSGGGCHNTYLMENIQQLIPRCKVMKTEELGVDPDAKEAILFALLANETICGSAIETGAGPRIMMGKISLP